MSGKALFIFFVILFTLKSNVTSSPYLENFDLDIDGSSVLVSWTTTEGFRCEDLTVEYATDTFLWQEVHRYPGICGSESKAENYDFLFRSPAKNIKVYFKINLGRYGVSEVISTIIREYALSGMQFVPHPANSSSILYLNNGKKEEVELSIYSMKGELLFHREFGRLNQIGLFELTQLPNGLYLASVSIGVLRRNQMFSISN